MGKEFPSCAAEQAYLGTRSRGAGGQAFALRRRALLSIGILGLSLVLGSSKVEAQTTSPSTQPAPASAGPRQRPRGTEWERNAGPNPRAYTVGRKKMSKISPLPRSLP
jgi:hypothetical protein